MLSPETLAVQVRRGACRAREVGRAAGAGLAGTGGVPAGLTPSMDLRFRGEGSTNHLKCSHDDLRLSEKSFGAYRGARVVATDDAAQRAGPCGSARENVMFVL